jgi:uncharacterized protein YigE (DUF2233 family)
VRRRFPILLLLWLAGCKEAEAPQEPRTPLSQVASESACRERSFEGTRFTVCKFDASTDRLELIGGQRSFADLEQWLGPRASRLRFAMNAGMYDEAGAPIGLFVRDGREEKGLNRREGAGNFHLMPNGVFAVDGEGRFSVTSSATFGKRAVSPQWATQSGPMLVIDGKLHPKFDENGESQLIRNGVGVADPGTAYFAISEDPVSFGRFARFFRDELGCRNALYLDGSVSSLWDLAGQRQDSYSELGPMIAVFRR